MAFYRCFFGFIVFGLVGLATFAEISVWMAIKILRWSELGDRRRCSNNYPSRDKGKAEETQGSELEERHGQEPGAKG